MAFAIAAASVGDITLLHRLRIAVPIANSYFWVEKPDACASPIPLTPSLKLSLDVESHGNMLKLRKSL